MAENNNLQVELDGLSYTLISTTNIKRLQEIADLVDAKIKQVRQQKPQYSGTRAAMLVSLQLAEELLLLQDEYLEVLEEAEIGAEAAPSKAT